MTRGAALLLGVGFGVGVGGTVGFGVGFTLGFGVGFTLGFGVGVGVTKGFGVGLGVGVGFTVGVGSGVGVGSTDGVGDGVGVGVITVGTDGGGVGAEGVTTTKETCSGVIGEDGCDGADDPFALIASTVKVYGVPFVRPPIVAGDEETACTCPVSTTVTTYEVIADPFAVAPEKVICAPWLIGVPATAVGAVGRPEGVTATAEDATERPAALTARTVAE